MESGMARWYSCSIDYATILYNFSIIGTLICVVLLVIVLITLLFTTLLILSASFLVVLKVDLEILMAFVTFIPPNHI
jgi:hypothetical protein